MSCRCESSTGSSEGQSRIESSTAALATTPKVTKLSLIAIPFGTDLTYAVILLLVRSALLQMDVPTRSSYVMAIVTQQERSAAASVTSVPRSLAAAATFLAYPHSGGR